MPVLRSLLSRYLAPHRTRVALILILLLIEAGAQLVAPRLIGAFIDNAARGASLNTLTLLALGFLALAIAGQLGAAVGAYLATDVGMRATNRLRSNVLRHVLGLDVSWHNATTPGALIERIDGDAANLNTMLSSMLPSLLTNGLLLVGLIVALALVDLRAGLIAIAFGGIAYVVIGWLQRLSTRAFEREREASSQLFGFIEERLAGAEDVRANGATAHAMQGFFRQSRAWGDIFVRANLLGSMNWVLPSLLYSALIVAVIALAVMRYYDGAITLGDIVVLYRYTDMLWRPLNNIGRHITELIQASVSAARLYELLGLRSKLVNAGDAAPPLEAGPLALRARNVSFTYDDANTAVIGDVSFDLPPRRVLGLLGRTGSGKTTLTRLIARLYDINAGQLTLNDASLSAIALSELRQRVTLVTQDVQIFSASVRDNITLFDASIDDAAVWAALDKVDLRTWAESLPKGLDTALSTANSGAHGLSAGQAQLLAFARAFLRDPGLVILDEASSRLDPATELQLERAIDALLKDRTGIIIAHRLATVERADDILVLDDGRVLEYGPRAQLAADPGSRYYALLNYGADEVLA
jgi:ABC-type multidrug transport system fused ATPase/permease subunit